MGDLGTEPKVGEYPTHPQDKKYTGYAPFSVS